jgi:hypothetical protein
MSSLVIIVVAAIVLLGLGFFVWRFIAYRGQRVIVCPETKQPAGVELDAWLAVRGIDGDAVLRLKSCSRWPERQDCDQDCLSQIEASPDGTLVRNIVTTWYRDRRCVYCSRVIGEIAWHDAMPALRAPDGSLAQWHSIATAEVPAILETHDAICWNCNLVEGFRREHPDLVTDRAETPLREHAREHAIH